MKQLLLVGFLLFSYLFIGFFLKPTKEQHVKLVISKSKHLFGVASYYSHHFHGKKTANGEIFNKNRLTAAHRTLPFGTMLKVTRVDSGKSIVVRINDRGPYIGNRIIDLSEASAKHLDFIKDGLTQVKLEVVDLNG